MRKSDKKMENKLRITLTEVCDTALKDFHGFEWLTHLVNYNNFPSSLKIICVFDTNDNLTSFTNSKNCNDLGILIQKKLFEIGVNLNNINSQITYITETNYSKNN